MVKTKTTNIHYMQEVDYLVYFSISKFLPMKIINKEQYAKTWSGFILGVISSVAGVLMVGTVLDRSVWAAEKAIKGKKDM